MSVASGLRFKDTRSRVLVNPCYGHLFVRTGNIHQYERRLVRQAARGVQHSRTADCCECAGGNCKAANRQDLPAS